MTTSTKPTEHWDAQPVDGEENTWRVAPARKLLREALEALESIGNHPTGGVGCNPTQFVAVARAAADKIRAALGEEQP